MMGSTPPSKPSSLKEVKSVLEQTRTEHQRLSAELEEARDWQRHKELRMQSLKNEEEYLAKERQRLEQWDAQVTAREKTVNKHYVLNAEMGDLSGDIQQI